jgi:GT2 family glycosyltransferase
MTPRVTAVITTYNRAEELVASVGRLLQQTRVPDEIWVIDDASTDNTESRVKDELPSVRYTKLARNVGIVGARNLALASVSTGYLLFLDDDSWFTELDGLERTLAFAASNPDATIVGLNVLTGDGRSNFCADDVPHPIRSFQGCAALFKMSTISRHELLFEEAFVRQGEEKDICLRVFDLGLSVCALPEIVVFHAVSDAGRNWPQIRFYEQRNDVLRELLRCPAKLLLPRVLRTWAAHTVYNLRHGFLLTDAQVLFALPWILQQAKRLRAPVSVEAYTLWVGLSKRSKTPAGAASQPILAKSA